MSKQKKSILLPGSFFEKDSLYKLEYLNEDKEVFKIEYYKTSKEVQEKLKVGDSTIYQKVKNIHFISRIERLNNINILRCKEPVYQKERIRIEYYLLD